MLTGIAWLVFPSFVATQLGMTLLSGVGLSTQIGDLASFFLTLGSCVMIGLITSKREWFYPAIMLLSIAAVGRILFWLFHDAALALDMIAVEAITAVMFYAVSVKLAET
jgi:energy-converting hydrogenase Eha subunit E